MDGESRYTLDDLEKLVDVSARTIRYYTGIGLLPPPDERGRYAYYSDDHLQRLRLIKRLKDVDLHLGTIKRYVDSMTQGQIEALLVGPPPSSPPAAPPAASAAARAATTAALDRQVASDDARAYIARVLAAQREARTTQDLRPTAAPAPAPAPALAPPQPPAISWSPRSAAWDHYSLAPGIELNVRQDAAGEWSSELDQLLAAAKELFKRRSK